MEFGDNDIRLTEGNEFDIFTSAEKGTTSQTTKPEESVTSTGGIDVTVHSHPVDTQYQNGDFQFPGLNAHFSPSIIRNHSRDWTDVIVQGESSLGNVALLRNVMASPFLFRSISPNQGRQENHFQQQSFPDRFPIHVLQNHSTHHTSQTTEQVRLDDSKSKNDDESMGKGIQLCFRQSNMDPVNVPYVRLSLQHENRQQGELINFQSMDMNNNQLAPETPDKSKRLEGHHFTELAHLADNRQTDGREHDNYIVQYCKEHVEVSRCDGNSLQTDCQSPGILQTHNILQEMGETLYATKTPVQKLRKKKHRPKVVVEGKPARKPRHLKQKSAGTPDNPARKRGRRKKEESSMGSQPNREEESSVKHSRTVIKSAKKHLDFDSEEFQLNNGNKAALNSKCNTDSQDKSNVESRSDTNFPLDNLTQPANLPFNTITNPLGQVPDKYSDLQDKQGSNPPSLRRQILKDNLKALARDRDKKEIGSNLDRNMSFENQAAYPPTPQIMKYQRSKRDHSHRNDDSEYDVELYSQLNHVTFKKRRMDNKQNKFASSTNPCTPLRGENHLNELNATLSFADVQNHLRKLQAEKYVLSCDQTEQRTNQTPETPVKKIKFVFRTDNTGYSQSPPGSNMPLVRYQTERSEILEASFQTTTPLKVPRRRRTKKESKTSSSQMGSSILLSTAIIPYVNVTYLTDLITLKLQHLNINGCSEVIAHQALQQENSLILYNSGAGAMVPFGDLFTPRKQRPRAKVDLDSETNRVWMLLMGKDTGNSGETGNDKEKWWEGERDVFRGRADSFIARMHLIQGDRRFSKWKGSVVDSVVGVFLTQNVSDHLSSSAFMSLAARYPNLSGSESVKACAENTSPTENGVISVEEGCDHIINIEKQVNAPQICNSEGSTLSHEAQCLEEKNTDVLNYSECTKTSETIINNNLKLSEGMNLLEAEYIRTQESTVSSQDSVISSQQSSESPAQASDQIGLSLVSNIRENINNNIWSSLHPHGSYTELLQMVGSRYLNEMYSLRGGSFASEGYFVSTVGFSESDQAKNLNQTLDAGPSIGKLDIEECCEQHVSAGVSRASSHSTPSNSNPESATSGVTLDKVNCSSEKNTTDFTGEDKSVFIDPSSSSIDHRFQPFPPSLVFSYCQSHLRNYNNISSKIDESMVNGKNSTSLNGHEEKLNLNSMEQEVRMNFAQGEQDNRKCEPCYSQTNCACTSRFIENSSLEDKHQNTILETVASTIKDQQFQMGTVKEVSKTRAKAEKKQTETFDWESLRRDACCNNVKKERSADKMDAIDWEAIRCAPASEVAETIKYRGMNNVLAARIKDFLDRLVREHGSIDLEWLRDVPPDKVKDYLLSIRGLGLKSVECVRLLTLEHLAFPVDTNVGRICVRLGWVPLQPLPESLQLHLLDMYPMLETIQKYLWPRLCTLDQRTLYELHYQLITFGKVFCTKTKPNCNSCPMRGECKHFASAFASARLALPGPEEKSLVSLDVPIRSDHDSGSVTIEKPPLQLEGNPESQGSPVKNCEPIVEEPATPEPEPVPEVLECDIEDTFYEDPDEIPTIKLNIEQFTQNLQDILQETNELQDGDISKALVALTPEVASIPQPKLKNVSRLRTEHFVYELPDTHPLLAEMDRREPDDPCPYLLAIWTPGETAQSTEYPETSCNSQCTGRMCDSSTCFSCNSIREAQAQKVRGTLLIPCRTAMRGSFPLNGTYFQVNEVFADHSSSINPIDVPRDWIWNLPRRTVYFGTSVTSIFRGLTTGGIQHCFWRGFVCVRGFDQQSRYPKPLLARLHFIASKDTKNKRTGIKNEE